MLVHLSEREQQVCLCLLRGHTLKSAARELEVAVSTAETYRKRAYDKLGIPWRARLVALCRGDWPFQQSGLESHLSARLVQVRPVVRLGLHALELALKLAHDHEQIPVLLRRQRLDQTLLPAARCRHELIDQRLAVVR